MLALCLMNEMGRRGQGHIQGQGGGPEQNAECGWWNCLLGLLEASSGHVLYSRLPGKNPLHQIGRASCRERV